MQEAIVHTGQHYDAAMSRIFFEELEIPEPHIDLGVGSGSHAVQTGEMMIRLEAFLSDEPRYDLVLVYGDTNSTLAAALVAAKLNLPLAHIEAGLRSFNRTMPEEVNRIVTDRLSDLLFCPSRLAADNLRREGIAEGVFVTGDVMYDAVLHFRARATERYSLESLVPFDSGAYYLATIHRAENTEYPDRLAKLLVLFGALDRPVVWPVHPRTTRRMEQLGFTFPSNVHPLEPKGYLEMLVLLSGARRVLTDSGGLQKEAYWLERPCVTLRAETEWTETLERGWNRVADVDPNRILTALRSEPEGPTLPVYGDGRASERIAATLAGAGGE